MVYCDVVLNGILLHCMLFSFVLIECRVGLGKERICKAHHLVDVSQELAMLIRARQKMKTDSKNEECNDQRPPIDKARKIARMNRVRQSEGVPDTAPVMVGCFSHFSAFTCGVNCVITKHV